MPYRKLSEHIPMFVDRYFPSLSVLDNALSALRAIDADVESTPQEREALKVYVGAHDTASRFNYRWCEECASMIGTAEHTHCPNCIYPCVTAGDISPELGIPANAAIKPCGHCGDCCRALGHRMCTTCNAHLDKACKHCNQCTKCCACTVCPDCNELQECECHRCYDHCVCPAPRPHPIYGKTFPAFKPKERKNFDCNRFAGIEWEYNRLRSDKYLKRWEKLWFGNRHEDASCGFEAVSAPVAGDYMVNCVSVLGTALNKGGALVDNRCSIHVHADAKDLQWTDMFRMLAVYVKVEALLYMIAGQDRLDNRYCLPCGKDYEAALKRLDRKDAVMAVAFNAQHGGQNGTNIPSFGRVSQRQRPGRRADVHRHARRRGLNILPWLAGRGPRPMNAIPIVAQAGDTIDSLAHRHGVSVASLIRWNKLKIEAGAPLAVGQRMNIFKRTIAPDTTVEFRIHPNTLDAERVTNWTKMIVRLVDWAAKSTDKDLESLPKSPLRALCQIAPDVAPWIITRVNEWRNETKRINGIPRRISLKGGKYGY